MRKASQNIFTFALRFHKVRGDLKSVKFVLNKIRLDTVQYYAIFCCVFELVVWDAFFHCNTDTTLFRKTCSRNIWAETLQCTMKKHPRSSTRTSFS